MLAVEENLVKLSGARVFSKLDANAGCWHVPLALASKELTVFMFMFQRLHFGITSAPEFSEKCFEFLEALLDRYAIEMIYLCSAKTSASMTTISEKCSVICSRWIALNAKKCEFAK